MHGISLPLTTTTSFLSSSPALSHIYFATQFKSSSIPISTFTTYSPVKTTTPRFRFRFRPAAAARRGGGGESPYQVLGVPPSATNQDIKRAYRKLALKLHPDVNKEANAQEKFMCIKHAYNTLLNSEARAKYDFGSGASDYSYSTAERSRSRKSQDEEFYGLGNFVRDVQITIGDFFRDIQSEFKNWETDAGSQGKPKSLWEELADIGEEFVEFLEKELNITDLDDEKPNEEPVKENSYERPRSEQSKADTRKDTAEDSNIENNIDEIEATLAQLKRELGL